MNTNHIVITSIIALIALAGVGAVGASAQEVGDKVWVQEEISTPYAIEATNDTVYVVDGTDTVYAVDAKSGGIKWRRSIPEGGTTFSTKIVIGEENIYLKVSGRETGLDSHLFAYNKTGNGLVWDHQYSTRYLYTYIDYLNGSVYLYQNPGYKADILQQLDSTNGEIMATTTIPLETRHSAGVVMTDEYVATGNESTVSIISVEDEEIVWQQRYGTVGAIYGSQSLYVVAGSDPVNNEFTSHVLSYDIDTRERTNDYNFPYDSRKAELFATTEERLLVTNLEDEQVIGYNTSAGELEYDISQDTRYAFATTEDIFISDESFRLTSNGEEVGALQSSLDLRGLRSPFVNGGINSEYVFLQAFDYNADHDEALVGVKAPTELNQEPSISPTDRVLQITGKSDSGDLTQDDVTATITRFQRGQSANGIEIQQNDVTTLITLFERN